MWPISKTMRSVILNRMMKTLLMPIEVDRIFRYRPGRAERLARKGRLPHIVLPDGEIRFDEAEIEMILQQPHLRKGHDRVQSCKYPYQ